MNWLDSSSFTGLLSQAQKSIDKVLDISTEDENKSKSGQNSETGILQSPKNQERKLSKEVEQKASSSWLSGGVDSFWDSFTQNTSGSPKKDTKEKNEKSFDEVKTKNKKTSEQEKANDVPRKESKLPNKAMNLKRNSKKKVLKKKVETSDGELNQISPAKGGHENEAQSSIESLRTSKDFQSEGVENHENVDFTDAKAGVVVNKATSDRKLFKPSNDDILTSRSNNIESENVNDVNENESVQENDLIRSESEVIIGKNEDDVLAENDGEKEKRNLEKEFEMTEQVENVDASGNDKKSTLEDDGFANIDLLNNEETKVENQNENSKKIGVVENEGEVPSTQPEEVVEERVQNLDLFSSEPVAASTPCATQSQEHLSYHSDHNDQLSNLNNDLSKANELPEHQNVEGEMVVDLGSAQDSNVMKVTKRVEGPELKEQSYDSVTMQENDRLLQIIEVRESKLVELSKENLNLQETNVVLRSQIEQLEEVHKSEDAELEQMKAEFTNRIGESEAKLQAAAKERDLFKKQLEETQKCLSSDIERQLKEFQTLLQQKDEQMAQLMEEGEKLSKQILQRNNNIKKLRAKEKELNTANENQRTRLEDAETEIERLTGILKERDDHEKEQDDAIKKLNAYAKKQDDLIAKQKVELEESAAKLPSLQTALDNAYKEITELNKVNAAKSTEVQEATLSVEMTAKEELRIALEKLKKESQKECDVLAMEVTDLQTQLSRSEQQAARREDNLRQEIADIQMRLQEAETRNQELTQSVSVATRPLLRQIENLQHSYGSQQTSWEKLEKNLTERLSDAQTQLATAQEKERASTERSIELTSKVASLESQVANYRQEKSRIEAEFELEKTKLEALEEYKSRDSGKVEALKTMHSKQLETMMVEKSLIEQQLVVERTKYESEQEKLTKLEEQLKERSQKPKDVREAENEESGQHTSLERRRSRNSSSSSVFSLSDTMTRNLPSGGTAVLEELRATIRHKEGELVSMQSAISTLEASRESLTEELTSLMNTNEDLAKENKQLDHIGKSFQELQTKYNALLQMYGEKQEETEELKLDLQDIKNMYKAQIQELLSGR